MIALLAAVALAAIPPADVIYVDGPILTMVEGQPPAEALAVRNGRIAAVGKKADVLALRGPSTRVVALGKRALLPAFVDPHSHFLAAVAIQSWANVSGILVENNIFLSSGQSYMMNDMESTKVSP